RDELPVFGYNYFEAARQLIDARRAFLRKYFTGGQAETERENGRNGKTPLGGKRTDQTGIKPGQTGPYVPTQEELDAIDRLTPAQKLDLLMRQREHRLTDIERRMYRSFLYPNGDTSIEDDQDASKKLTDAQKVDLLIR